MMKRILSCALAGIAVIPAQAHAVKRHHAHAVARPDSVTLDGKAYNVCKPGMQDDCIQPREAGLGYGNRPSDTYHPGKTDRHP